MSELSPKRAAIYSKCNGRCAYCGESSVYELMTIDHIIPRYYFKDKLPHIKKKMNSFQNLNPACEECNQLKGNLSIERFRKLVMYQLNMSASHFNDAIEKGNVFISGQGIKFYFEIFPPHTLSASLDDNWISREINSTEEHRMHNLFKNSFSNLPFKEWLKKYNDFFKILT